MRRLSLSIAVTAVILSFATMAEAAVSAYSADVSVDITAENAAAARERAMVQANRQAVNAVAANFTTKEGISVLNRLTDDQLLNFIKETTVLEEKTSSVRYIAKLRITAHDQLLKQYLQEKNVPLVVTSAANVTIVPIFRETVNATPKLWEDDNLWRNVWEQNPPVIGAVRFASLGKNNQNLLNTADQALSADTGLFRNLSDATGGSDVYIVEAFYPGDEGLTIRIINPQTENRQTFSVSGARSPELFNQAVRETSLRISDELKGSSIVTSGTPETISVLYKYNKLSDWLRAEKRISNITSVENVEINAIGNGRVQFQINLVGGVENLTKALQNSHLSLSPSNNYYTLSDM